MRDHGVGRFEQQLDDLVELHRLAPLCGALFLFSFLAYAIPRLSFFVCSLHYTMFLRNNQAILRSAAEIFCVGSLLRPATTRSILA
jgi:hypothetical protein